MKKKLLLVVIFLVSILLIFILRDKPYGHTINYLLEVDNQEFKIKEVLIKKEGYYLSVEHNKNNYLFHYDDVFNNQKKILEKIAYYQNGHIECLYPIYKDDHSNNNILCQKDNDLYSYTSLKQTNSSFEPFSSLDLELFKESTTFKTYNRLSIYQENIPKNNYLIVWNYKGIDLITKNNLSSINYLNQDCYDNTHGIMIDNLYLTPDYNEKYDFTKFIVIDVTNKKKSEFKLKTEISYDSYINGIVDHKLYLFDKDNLVEYEFDLENNKSKIIGNKELNGKYYDGKWQEKNIYDFLNKEIYFTKNIDLNESYQTILESDHSYYLYDKSGKMYQIYKNNLKTKILLFTKKNITDLKISNDFIYFRVGINIYLYHDNYGLRKVLENNEFTYNSTNIYDIYCAK